MARFTLGSWIASVVAVGVTTLVLAMPSAALADPPTAQTNPNPQIAPPVVGGPWAAQMRGDVTTGGLDTTYYFQYALSGDQFCTSQGASGTPSSSAVQILPAAFSRANVGAAVYGLANGSGYCYRFVTTNSDGTAYGGIDTFTYSLPRPAIAAPALTTTGASTATMVGLVSPNGQATSVEVAYDVAGSEFCANRGSTDAAFHTPLVTIGAIVASQDVSLTLSGLTPGTQYCAGLLATNPSGTATAFGPAFTAGVPLLWPGSTTTAIGDTAASVTGTVDPVGQTTTYDVAYDAINSTWCRSGGASGAPSLATQQLPLPFTDTTYHAVTVKVSGLAPTTSYCLALVIHNASGEAAGAPALLPAMPTLTVALPTTNMGPIGAESVTSSPKGISCPRRCSAPFQRGARVRLRATANFGASLAGWNPFYYGGSGPPPPSPPCANTRSLTCTITLSRDTSVVAEFNGPPYSCGVSPDGSKLHNGTLYLTVTCNKSARVTITGKLTDVPKTGKTKTSSLRPLRPTGFGYWWRLSYKVPRSAVDDLRKGASESIKLTLSYSWRRSSREQRTTATITDLTD
jgi:hypothetical protein